jgi:hypothetical protein
MYQDITVCVKYRENQISSSSPQTKGICQGCGLGLYFFNILINDITDYLDIEGTHSLLMINGLRIPGLLFAHGIF